VKDLQIYTNNFVNVIMFWRYISLHATINFDIQKMEDMLQTFQGSLGNISEEIKTLQDKSFSMNIKLKNRKNAEQQLAKFIQQAVVAPSLVRNICETEVNEAYLDYLITLDMKNDFLKNEGNVSTQAAQELIPKVSITISITDSIAVGKT
jgi:hypothetical protein